MSFPSLFHPILAIPAYQIFCFLPHAYASRVLASHGYKIDTSNPRTTMAASAVQGKVPDAALQKSQRAKAAEANCFEHMPIFAAAVLASIVANRLSAQEAEGDDIVGLTKFIAWWFALRSAFVVAYVSISNPKISLVRSALWAAGLVLLCAQFYSVAKVLG